MSCRTDFDPDDWNRVYDDPQARAKNFIFQRSSELAGEVCDARSRPGQRWLDIGCGTGHLARRLTGTGASVVAVDHSLRMLVFARQRAADGPPLGRLQFAAALAEKLPFSDSSMHGVVASSLVGCLPSAEMFFAEVRRVLCKDGHIVVTFTNQASWLLKLNYLWPNRRETPDGMSDPERYRLYHSAQVAHDIEKLGFRIVQIKFYNFV